MVYSHGHGESQYRGRAPLFSYGPTIDNDLVSNFTFTLFGEGKFMKIPVIFGDDTNEGTIFTPHPTATVARANEFLLNNFPFLNDTELAIINNTYMSQPDNPVYPHRGEYWQGVSNAYGEMRYICPGINISSVVSDHGVPVWNYHYAVEDKDQVKNGGFLQIRRIIESFELERALKHDQVQLPCNE